MVNRLNSELNRRMVTGLLGGALIVALVLFAGSIGMMIWVTFLSIAMLYEYTEIIFVGSSRLEQRYLLLFLGWCLVLGAMVLPQSEGALMISCFLVLFIYFLWSAQKIAVQQLARHFQELTFAFFGLIYLSLVPSYLLKLHESAHGVHWTLLFLIVVWSGDTAAYFVGKKYGKRKLYPSISPKKTWEGALGGLLAGMVAVLIYRIFVFQGLGLISGLLFALCVGVVAQIGDLCESFFKRAFEQKDSGSLLPGHGGFLDRFDGVVLSLPVAYAFVRLMG